MLQGFEGVTVGSPGGHSGRVPPPWTDVTHVIPRFWGFYVFRVPPQRPGRGVGACPVGGVCPTCGARRTHNERSPSANNHRRNNVSFRASLLPRRFQSPRLWKQQILSARKRESRQLVIGAPEGIRTPDPQIRSLVLHAKLRRQVQQSSVAKAALPMCSLGRSGEACHFLSIWNH